MRTKKNRALFIFILIISILSINNSCSERNETVSCFPNTPISAVINLSLPAYYNLQTPGNWAYTRDETGTGTNGLIIYSFYSNTTNKLGFMIYDRNAPHICPGTDTVLKVNEGSTKVICPKDNAEWFLTTGQPLNDIAKTGLKTYRYYDYNPNTKILSVYN